MRPIYPLLALVILAGCGGGGGNDVSTPVITSEIFGSSEAGLVDGPANTARFSNPANVAVAPDGTVYVADFDNDAVRAIDTSGNVTTLIKQDGFVRPFGLAVTADGSLYIETDANGSGDHSTTDTGSIWWYNPASGTATLQAENLGRPRGMLALPDGRIALADIAKHTISLFDPETATVTPLAGMAGESGFANGSGTTARFNRPYGMGYLAGTILVADQDNNRIRAVTLDGVVSTYAGTGEAGNANGSLTSATFNGPQAVSVGANGTILVADQRNHVIRRISGTTVSTFAGDGTAGYREGTGNEARFYGLEGIALTRDSRTVWIADGNDGDGSDHNRVRWLAVN